MSKHRVAALAGVGALLALALGSPRLSVALRERRLRQAPRPLDVVLLTLDTTRADRLGCYGSRDVATPSLDALAARGVRFESAYSHVPLTCPSHASILTGLIPPRHGVHDNGAFVLGPEPATLAEAFVDAGYRTGAFVSAFVLDRRFGLARGFATYEDEVPGGGGENAEASVRGDVTVDRALAWLRRDSDRPTFLWVHLYDPHHPYEPPEPFASRYKDRPYDGEVAYTDVQVGRLLDGVRARGRPALIAVIGDHGESLGEHQELTHGYFIYGATQRVPLVISLPGHLPEGRAIGPVVRAVDLMPTLLDVAGLRAPPELDGRSLVPLITGRSAEEPGPAYLESYQPRLWWGAGEVLGLRTGHWLFIRSRRPELYRTDLDGGETSDLAAKQAALMQELGGRLARMTGGGDPLAGQKTLDPDAEARLRALGYVGPGTPAAPSGELPDAKDNGALLAGHTRASQLLQAGRKEEALAAFRETLVRNPRSTSVRLSIAKLLLDLGRAAESLEAAGEILLEDRDNESAVLLRSRSQAVLAQKAERQEMLRAAVLRRPRSAALHEELGAALADSGELAAAEGELGLAVSLAPRQLTPRLSHGLVLLRLKRWREGAEELAQVVALSPRSQEAVRAQAALVSTGAVLLDAGAFEESRKAYEAALASGARTEAVYLNLALATYRSGRRGPALEVLQSASTVLPGSAEIHYRLGRLLQEAGRPQEATAEYRQVLELDPKRADAAKAIAGIGAAR